MHNVIGNIYSSSLFTYVKEQRCFAGEISMTPGVLRQLWNDAMDLGFGIRSEKTGKIVFFTLQEIERDDEGDICKWKFVVYNPRDLEELRGLSVNIYND